MPDVLIFTAFIILYALYLWTSIILVGRYTSDLKNDKLIQGELMILISNVFFFAFVFLIGRFINLSILLISIAASNIGLLIGLISWSLLGNPKVPYKATGAWAAHNLSLNNAWINKYISIIGLVAAIVYPVFIGIYFFRDIPVEDLRLLAVRCTVIFILSSYLVLMPVILNGLSAGYVDEDSRSRYLIAQFAGLIPNALFISMLFWTFNAGDTGKQVAMGGVSFSFDPLLFGVLMVFFLLFLLLPYFIGIQQAKRLKSELFAQKNKILQNLVDDVELAAPGTVIPKLDEAITMLQNNYKQLVEENKGISLGLTLDQANSTALNRNERYIYDIYQLARPFDKRFEYSDFLAGTYENVVNLKNALGDPANAGAYDNIQKKYADHFKSLRKELNDEQDKKGRSNPVLWIAIVGILSPFISQALTEIGKWLIEYVKK